MMGYSGLWVNLLALLACFALISYRALPCLLCHLLVRDYFAWFSRRSPFLPTRAPLRKARAFLEALAREVDQLEVVAMAHRELAAPLEHELDGVLAEYGYVSAPPECWPGADDRFLSFHYFDVTSTNCDYPYLYPYLHPYLNFFLIKCATGGWCGWQRVCAPLHGFLHALNRTSTLGPRRVVCYVYPFQAGTPERTSAMDVANTVQIFDEHPPKVARGSTTKGNTKKGKTTKTAKPNSTFGSGL
jgi:hypothetical protein